MSIINLWPALVGAALSAGIQVICWGSELSILIDAGMAIEGSFSMGWVHERNRPAECVIVTGRRIGYFPCHFLPWPAIGDGRNIDVLKRTATPATQQWLVSADLARSIVG